MKWLTSIPNIFKKVTWLKINKWAVDLILSSSDLYLYDQIQKHKV